MAFPLEIDLGKDGGLLRFRRASELAEFLAVEEEAWGFLRDEGQRSNQLYGKNAEAVQLWKSHRNALGNIRSSLDGGSAEDALSAFTQLFTSGNSLPLWSSLQGALVARVLAETSPRAALGTISVLKGFRLDGDDPEQLRGAFIAQEFLQATGSTARRSVQSALTGLLDRISNQQRRAEDKADALDRRTEEIEARRRRHFARLMAEGDKARHKFAIIKDEEIQAIRAAAAAAEESIRKTEKVYTEHMALQGPVTYWRTKATQHKRNALIARLVGIGFAGALVIYAFVDGATRVLELVKDTVAESHQWQLGYVVLTMVGFILTVAFWIGRLISRTYVSEAHLAIDAEERATMVQTYLALANENKITDGERVLVLQSLFRSSSDGLVKDDAAPDLSLAGIASRLGAGATPR